MKRGVFIVIDGMDGSGKSTEVRLLRKDLRGTPALFTHEPGGTPHAEKIREVLLTHKAGRRDAFMDFFLFWAARVAHMREAIIPALKAGKVVVTDRFDSSTYAFQVRAEKHSELERPFWECRKAVLGKYTPDAYIILDLPAAASARRRRADRSKKLTTFDKQNIRYHERVRAGFKKFKPDSEMHFVNANRDVADVHADVRRIVQRLLAKRQ
ncbi:MAG: dTMP kinase [Patescibacteria group bacterium]|nr:dTMP kinase [Patescibacteria group bacterium]